MRRRKLEELAVIELKEKQDAIAHSQIRNALLEKPSDTIYLSSNNTLFGMVCLGDWLHRAENGMVPIATKFTCIDEFDEEKAKRIFEERGNIHKVPIVDGNGTLLGDYSRWIDGEKNWCKWVLSQSAIWKKVKKYLKKEGYEKIYVITPAENKIELEKQFLSILEKRKIKYVELDKTDLHTLQASEQKILVISMDKEENRSIWGLDGYDNHEANKLAEYNTITWLYERIEEYVRREEQIHYSAASEGVNNLLVDLQKQGVMILQVYRDPYYASDYVRRISKEISDNAKRYRDDEEYFKAMDIQKRGEYFGELLENEDYRCGVAQEELVLGFRCHTLEGSYGSKYYNVIDGKRKTCYTPVQYENKIHMFGQCMFMGVYMEDKCTQMSQLQKKLADAGYPYLVESHGAFENVFEMMEKVRFFPGDVAIIYTGAEKYEGVTAIDIGEVFERHNVKAEWFLGCMTHYNHRAAGILAEEYFHKMEPFIRGKNTYNVKNEIRFQPENYRDILGNYIKKIYLDAYFEDYYTDREKACLVVDLNTPPKVYERMIKQICSKEEQLIVFIPAFVEGAKYLPWEYKNEMILRCGGEEKVFLISGERIVPYWNYFRFYYARENHELIGYVRRLKKEAKIDVQIFADCIASQLNIKRRYNYKVEEEGKKEYYYGKVLREELPKYGMEYIEIE